MRRIVAIAVVPVLIIGFAAVAVVWIEAAPIAHVFLRGMAPAAAVSDVRLIAPLLPLGALVAVLVSAARGFGRMWPFLTIQGLGQPATRLALVTVGLVLGWGLRGALIGWGIPVVIGVIVSALIALAMLIRREVPAVGRELARSRSGRTSHRLAGSQGASGRQGLAAEFWRFTAPRGFSGTFQIIVIWLDILLVGLLLSRYAAGIYGAVSKLVLIGTFALQGSRLAIGPELSALLARHQTARAARLHQNATHWLMIASWPFYIIISIFPGRGSRYLRAPLHGRSVRASHPRAGHARESGHGQRYGGPAHGREELAKCVQCAGGAYRKRWVEPSVASAHRNRRSGDRLGGEHSGRQRGPGDRGLADARHRTFR